MLLLGEALHGRSGHDVGRQLLETLYHRAAGEDLPPIAVTDRGKPYFVNSPWHFSISHTQNHVFCVLSRNNVGLDAEEIGRPVNPKLAERYLSETEKMRIGEKTQETLLRLWVLKEAEAKRTGQGIGNWMKNTDFDPFDRRIQEINGCYVAVLEDKNAV